MRRAGATFVSARFVSKSNRLAVAVGAVLAGAVVAWLLWHQRPAASRGEQKRPTASSAIPSEIRLAGTIRARQVVPVAAPIDGILEQFMVEPGQEVFEGQLLARIRNAGLDAAQQAAQSDLERVEGRVRGLESSLIAARLEASRARAEAERVRDEYEKARRTFERQQFLFREGATPRLVFERAQKEFEAAREQMESVESLARVAEDRVASLNKELDGARVLLEEKRQALEEARQNLAATEVHSPVDGVLLSRSKQVGDAVGPHVRDLFQIAVDLSLLEVVLEPEPPLLERIRPGQPALVEILEGPASGLLGRVLAVEKNGQVVVEFGNPSPAVKPGMSAHVRIRLDQLVPQ